MGEVQCEHADLRMFMCALLLVIKSEAKNEQDIVRWTGSDNDVVLHSHTAIHRQFDDSTSCHPESLWMRTCANANMRTREHDGGSTTL
jgi:hypothetical protein